MNAARTLNQTELNHILALHERHGAAMHGFRTEFKGAGLDGLNLANRRLSGVDFTAASLVGATLFGSSLTRTRFFGADLRRCDLRNADLTASDLRGACLNRANLSFAKLDGADLRAVVMVKSGPNGMPVADAPENRQGGKPIGVDFTNSSMKGVSFTGAHLQGADFSNAVLEGAVFRGAKITDSIFHGAVLTGVEVKDLNVPPEALHGCVFDVSQHALKRAAVLNAALDAHEKWVATNGKEGAPAVLDGEDLRPLRKSFVGRRLTALSARRTIAIGVEFQGCRLQGAKFQGADLRDANFTDADLAGVSFRDAKLAHAVFDKANIAQLRLLTGEIVLPDFAGAEVVEEQFRRAVVEPGVFHPSVKSAAG